MAVRTDTATVARVTDNGPQGAGTTIRGTVGFDKLGPREGLLVGVEYQVFLTVQTTGGLVNDGATFFGSATTFFGFDLDRGNDDGLGMDVVTGIQDGLSSIPLLAGAGVSTPVSYGLTERSPVIDVPQLNRFVGGGEVRVDFELFSGVAAFGGQVLGPQGGSFTNANTARVVVEYEYRRPVEGSNKADRLDGRDVATVVLGLDGDDAIRGGGGNDRLYGDTGRDNIAGESGTDRLYGGPGADVFVFTRGDSRDMVADFGAGDRLDLSRLDADRGDVTLSRAGEDTVLRVDGRAVALLEDIRPDDVNGREDFIL